MLQNPRPQSTAATVSGGLPTLCGFISCLALLVAMPGFAEEPPKSIPQTDKAANASAPGSDDVADDPLDTSLFRATADELEANTMRKVDLIVHGRTLRMMEQLRRINDKKMSAASELAHSSSRSRSSSCFYIC